MTPRPDIALHSDEDAFRWLHTEDASAASWTVRAVDATGGEEVVERVSPGPWLPGAGFRLPTHAWAVGSSWCHLEVVDSQGESHSIGRCVHTLAQ